MNILTAPSNALFGILREQPMNVPCPSCGPTPIPISMNAVPTYKIVEISLDGQLTERFTFDSTTIAVNATLTASEDMVIIVTSTWEKQLLNTYSLTTHTMMGEPQEIFTYPDLGPTVPHTGTLLPIIQDIWITDGSHINAIR